MARFIFIKKYSTWIYVVLLVILLIPSFWRMLRPGIYSMHDFHVFRLYEYDKCIADLQIPCRWAPDSSLGYGQPVFNFYGQFPYIFGEIFRGLGLSVIDSTKALFIASLVLSGLAMFLLSKQLWKDNSAAILSALLYVYAPYRAVDVWVRGALPEALSFIFFPLIIYFFNDYILHKRFKSLLLFGLTFSLLIINHNLSALMFLFTLVVWGIYFLTVNKGWGIVWHFILIGGLVFGLTAFYILPVAAETKLISVDSTASGVYAYELHFVTLRQLLISRYWGYGASFWGDDDRLSLSVGHFQWIIPLVGLGYLLIAKKLKQNLSFVILFGLGWFFLFLTHGKSNILWKLIPGLPFIQFPWRFLGSAIFAFALSGGLIGILVKKLKWNYLIIGVVGILLIASNFGFFFEDLWFNYSDKDQFSGAIFKTQASSAITDFWPKTAKDTPKDFAPLTPTVITGVATGQFVDKRSYQASYTFKSSNSDNIEVQFPIVYFPGWEAYSTNKSINLYPKGDLGLNTATLGPEDRDITIVFKNTPIRRIGNLITLGSMIIWFILFVVFYKKGKVLV